MESCFKLINRDFFELNKITKNDKKIKNLLNGKSQKEKVTIIDKLRLIRKNIKEQFIN